MPKNSVSMQKDWEERSPGEGKREKVSGTRWWGGQECVGGEGEGEKRGT